ncbi:uncharacterized protein BXZ73DRAFT_107904 [Epithele typhae]|uniref:uncharacterized protein n=1 Tax=Epithele typhae TaxID=378194 RepID=UPI002008C42E|nr:uncharacterized protein BXZ73DRAFT_107904 [Epithele typhae]KAH9911565.1 hypothetical protein BXZ73DRAFT_107904 [Epithele typhae]
MNDFSTNQASGLRCLGNDILLQIFEELRSPLKGLFPLSEACGQLRELCLPVLFRAVKVKSRNILLHKDAFVPDYIWPHVQTLYLDGIFCRYELPRGYYGRANGIGWDLCSKDDEDGWEAAAIHEGRVADFLRNTLRLMPRMRTVVVNIPNIWPCDIDDAFRTAVPLPAIIALLSIPHLPHLEVIGTLYHMYDKAPRLLDIPSITLTTFKYKPLVTRFQPRSYASEAELLKLLLPALSPTICTLHVPMENLPLSELPHHDWPRLRELVIEGEYSGNRLPPPFIPLLARMPALRRLHLCIAHQSFWFPSDLEIIWPVETSIDMPWPELEDLLVAHPNPDDKLWDHLPSTLHTLRLQCWPHHFEITTLDPPIIYREGMPRLGGGEMSRSDEVDWKSPVLGAADIRRIMRACSSRARDLRKLEMEYNIQEDENSLLREIAESLPRLHSLTLFRYDPEVDQVIVGVPVPLVC